MTDRRVELALAPPAAWERVLAAARDVGKVEESNPSARFLVMKARYGLNPVRLRITVLSGASERTSVIEIGGRGQDVMGVASRKVIDRLLLQLG